MKTTVEALQDYYVEAGGQLADVADITTIPDMIDAITALGGGSGSSLPAVTSDDNGKVLAVVEGAWDKAAAPAELPSVSATDNGDVLGVVEGAWAKMDAPSALPSVTSEDNGDVLTVVDGAWGKATPSAGGENVKVITLTSQGGLPSGVTGATLKNDYDNGVVVVLQSPAFRKFLMCAGITENGNSITYTSPIYMTNNKPMYTRGTVGPWASGTTVTITEETLVLET